MLNSETLSNLNNAFVNAGFEIRIVGGAVRDYALGIPPSDIDLATTATPMEMIVIAASNEWKIIPTGIDHGTMTFVIGDETFEVTTLRVDTDCDGRHSNVEFTTNWEADAARRDFTINAMSLEIGTYFLHDYFGGIDDVNQKRIVFVGKAEDRIKEDYLRIFRAFRFAARFDFRLDFYDVEAIKKNIDGIVKLSGERIWQEMSKILSGRNRMATLFEMESAGVLDMIGLRVPSFIPKTNDPVTILSLLTDHGKVTADRFKLSNKERSQLEFLKTNEQEAATRTVKKIAVMLMDHPREHVVAWVNVHYADPIFLTMAKKFDPPVFPLNGQDILDLYGIKGKFVGEMLAIKRQEWIQSDFEMTREQLMKM